MIQKTPRDRDADFEPTEERQRTGPETRVPVLESASGPAKTITGPVPGVSIRETDYFTHHIIHRVKPNS